MKRYGALPVSIVLVLSAACKKYAHHSSTPAGEKMWTVTTIAGDGSPHFGDGPALLSKFSAPLDVTSMPNGILFVADGLNHRIRKIENGQVTTIAGFDREDTAGGVGTAAGFAIPIQITSDGTGNLYTLDIHDFRVRKINSNAVVSLLAGNGVRGFADGSSLNAEFGECSGIVADGHGNIYVSDYDNKRIRKIDANGSVMTIAGNGTAGFVDANKTGAEFFAPAGIVMDNQGNLFVGDFNRIRRIAPNGDVSTLVGSGASGFRDGGPSVATFTSVGDMAIDAQGNLYVTDGDRIRRITPQGEVSTIAGYASGYMDGDGSVAKFNGAAGLGVDADGNIYVADAHNNRIRKISFQ